MSTPSGAAATAARLRSVLAHGQPAELDGEYAGDHWNAVRLGVPARRGRRAARFDSITQDWLRDPVKRWSRFRLATGCAFATISAGALALSRFSGFLAERHPGIADETGITRPVLEDYLSWLLTKGYSASTRALSLSMLRVFTDACRRHGWLPGLAPGAVIYTEELPFHHDQVARFIPEFVMAQLESDTALDRLPFTTTRNLVVVLIETGLRGGDACGLEFSPTLDDSAGWPCLRFEATKVRAEQLIPLSARARNPAMTRADNTQYRTRAAADRHRATLRKASDAIAHLDSSGQPVNFSAVAAAAGVSRASLYRDPDIRELISRIRSAPSRTATTRTAERATAESLRACLNTACAEITRLRAENTMLREQAARHLGEQRAGTHHPIRQPPSPR